MVSLHYPSVWRNRRTMQQWDLRFAPNIGSSGEDGCIARSGTGLGKVYWAKEGDTFILCYISAQPRRSGLGALLTYAFADAAQMAGAQRVSISMANPHEHGFYRYMGVEYDQLAMNQYVDSLNDDELVQNFQPLILEDEGEQVTILPAQIGCPLVGETHHIFTRSHAATERAWALMPHAKPKIKSGSFRHK